MHWQRIKKQVLPVVVLLTLAGCATSPPETAKKPPEPTPAQAASSAPEINVTASVTAPAETAQPESNKPAEAKPEVAKSDAPDIWARLRKGFAMKPLDSPQVDREIQWFVNNPEYMQRMMERARLYLYYIADEVEKRGMPMEIA
ncbi:MAG: hypothetical protein HY083_04390, partial [Gammaproteobacteria bacterium]|nr:hypothetical protein [Gammaproteobacteria bacterium]